MDELTVADVYEQAASIGLEIESLIRLYGQESVEGIMPKIVHLLEQLEALVERRQRDLTTVSELRVDKESLMVESKRETLLKRQLEEKVEYLENLMTDDTTILRDKIAQLSKENAILRLEIEVQEAKVVKSHPHALSGDVEVMMKMKATIDTQRDQIRELNMSVERDRLEVEALQEQSNRLTAMNERLRELNARLQEKLRRSTLEGAEVKAQLTTIQQNNEGIFETDGGLADDDGSSVDLEGDCYRQKDDSGYEHDIDRKASDSCSSGESSPTRKDPNRPRYTLSEMQKVLHERNLLKEKVHALEDELSIFRPPSPIETFSPSEIESAKRKATIRKESGVRKFFGFFYKKEDKPNAVEDSVDS